MIQRITHSKGRVFIVGDIHGMFWVLEALLKKVGFNEEFDRVISTGDLVDRGDESHRVAEFVHKKWFSPVKGNHEELMIDAIKDPGEFTWQNWEGNGGGWENKSEFSFDELADIVDKLPIVIELDFFGKKVGITHTGVPHDENDWDHFIKDVNIGRKTVINEVLWGRVRNAQCRRSTTEWIENVHLVVGGHTIGIEPVMDKNSLFIDTGAFFMSKGFHSDEDFIGDMVLVELIIDDDGELVFDSHFFQERD